MSTHSQVRSTLPAAENPPPRTHGLQDAGRQVSQTSPLMDAQQAAGMLGVPQTWLLAQARANAVPHHRLGHYVRFDETELIRWVETGQPSPGGRLTHRPSCPASP